MIMIKHTISHHRDVVVQQKKPKEKTKNFSIVTYFFLLQTLRRLQEIKEKYTKWTKPQQQICYTISGHTMLKQSSPINENYQKEMQM
jgi:hypothetical protein